jgi:hypothetical protein
VTEHRPPACHYDRTLGERVTTEHRDDCTNPADHRGCAPCTAPHCTVCGREHVTNDHPVTCPTCLGKIREDLDELGHAYDDLAVEATDAASDGRLVAAAPIPGGVAQILRGPTVGYQDLRFSRTMRDDHPISTRTGRPVDPMPPLAVLAVWEDHYRAWLGHDPAGRASLHGAIAYLRDQLPYISQHTRGPDWVTFTREIRALRSGLEHALHDEQEPQRGVECFECGDNLVRRWHTPARCTHPTPARRELRRWLQLGYPEALTRADIRAARRPCGRCDQGGISYPARPGAGEDHDPRRGTAGVAWECPSCRREYDPGEYATAVRRDLLTNGANGDGWTHISMAAEAASTMTGGLVLAATVRKWMDRSKVASCCLWEPGKAWGVRLVFWPDVADAALELNRRVIAAELERRRRAEQWTAWSEAVEDGEDPKGAGVRLGIDPARVRAFIDQHDRIGA